MKVNYRLKNRLKYPHLKKTFILVIIFILGAIIFSFIDRAVISFVSPIWQAENLVSRSLRSGSTFLRTQKALTEENVMLKEKLSSLELEIFTLSSGQIQEESLLKELLFL